MSCVPAHLMAKQKKRREKIIIVVIIIIGSPYYINILARLNILRLYESFIRFIINGLINAIQNHD